MFFLSDLTLVNTTYHLLHFDKCMLYFATEAMLHELCRSKTWYMNGTFKLINRPFQQLYCYTALRARVYNEQQLCEADSYSFLLHVALSDYKSMLEELVASFPQRSTVTSFVLDFEQAAWKAVSKIFLHAEIRGCAFPLGVKPCGEDNSVDRPSNRIQKYWKNICNMSTSYGFASSAGNWHSATRLQRRANTLVLQQLFNYVEDTLIESLMLSPVSWSVYQCRLIRTSNDVEGWHPRT